MNEIKLPVEVFNGGAASRSGDGLKADSKAGDVYVRCF